MPTNDSYPKIPIDAKSLWKLVTVVAAIVAATFWIIDRIDKRIKEQSKSLEKKAVIPALQCHEEHKQLFRQLEFIRADIDEIFNEQTRLRVRRGERVYRRSTQMDSGQDRPSRP